jgi:hypothetical protein
MWPGRARHGLFPVGDGGQVAPGPAPAISPKSGQVIKVLSSSVVPFHTATGRVDADSFYGVLALDATGKDALVEIPRFGNLTGGVFTRLSGGAGIIAAAAW